MDQLTPVIPQLHDRAARLTMAIGAVDYVARMTTIDDIRTVDTAVQALDHVSRELNDTLNQLRALGDKLEQISDEGMEFELNPRCLTAYPTPDYTRLEIDFGEVRVVAPSTGLALDALVDTVTEARKCLRTDVEGQ